MRAESNKYIIQYSNYAELGRENIISERVFFKNSRYAIPSIRVFDRSIVDPWAKPKGRKAHWQCAFQCKKYRHLYSMLIFLNIIFFIAFWRVVFVHNNDNEYKYTKNLYQLQIQHFHFHLEYEIRKIWAIGRNGGIRKLHILLLQKYHIHCRASPYSIQRKSWKNTRKWKESSSELIK